MKNSQVAEILSDLCELTSDVNIEVRNCSSQEDLLRLDKSKWEDITSLITEAAVNTNTNYSLNIDFINFHNENVSCDSDKISKWARDIRDYWIKTEEMWFDLDNYGSLDLSKFKERVKNSYTAFVSLSKCWKAYMSRLSTWNNPPFTEKTKKLMGESSTKAPVENLVNDAIFDNRSEFDNIHQIFLDCWIKFLARDRIFSSSDGMMHLAPNDEAKRAYEKHAEEIDEMFNKLDTHLTVLDGDLTLIARKFPEE